MTPEQYQSNIPIFCKCRTVEQHAEILLFCWGLEDGIKNGNLYRGVEGPQFCHDCDVAIRAKRWDRVWRKKVFGCTND